MYDVSQCISKLKEDFKQTIFTIPIIDSPDAATHKQTSLLLSVTGLSLMHIAAFEDSLETFMFLEQHIPIDIKSADSYLPIHYACLNGSVECLTYILDKDPVQATTIYKTEWQCLQLATAANSPEVLQILFDYKADLKAVMNGPNDPIGRSIKQKNVECLKLLLKHCPMSLRNTQNMTLIMLALINNKPDAIPLLIDAGVDLSFISADNQTALSLACFQGQTEIVRLICQKLDNIDLPPTIKSKAAVHWLCESKSPEIARIILEKEIDVNRVDKDGHLGPFYLLDVAESDVLIEILELLVNAGLKIDSVANPTMNTLLGDYVTGIKKQYEVIDWLLSQGANIDAPLKGISNEQTIADFILDLISKDMKESSLGLMKIAQKWIPDRLSKLSLHN